MFFICGASTGLLGTALGVGLGCLFALYIDPIFSFAVAGVWDPLCAASTTFPPLQVVQTSCRQWAEPWLSCCHDLPARRAARMKPGGGPAL